MIKVVEDNISLIKMLSLWEMKSDYLFEEPFAPFSLWDFHFFESEILLEYKDDRKNWIKYFE